MADIIDTIDSLIDSQLSEGEPWRGYDAGDPDFPRCPHCDRDWHGFPLTEQVADMHRRGLFDEGYRVCEDRSAVLCPGSDAYGPARPEARLPAPSSLGGDWYGFASRCVQDLIHNMGCPSELQMIYEFTVRPDTALRRLVLGDDE